jgi:hypothetical protein
MQYQTSVNQSKAIRRAVLQSHMQRYDATTAYNCYYLDSIGYTIAATRVSLNQYKAL